MREIDVVMGSVFQRLRHLSSCTLSLRVTYTVGVDDLTLRGIDGSERDTELKEGRRD
jgi:hypothetical protein